MKIVILFFLLIQAMSFSLSAQTSAEETAKLKQVNQETIAAYKSGKIGDALKSAQAALALTLKIFGAEHIETATSYSNLGAIYRADKKYREAAENFQKALAIYQKNPKQNAGEIAQTSESLGILLALDGKKKQGEELLLQSITSAENAFGKQSIEILPYLKSLAEFYIYVKNPDEAQKIFVRRFLTTAKHSQPGSRELDQIEDEFNCFILLNYPPGEYNQKQKQFYESTINAENKALQNAKSELPGKTINSGVVNGKAKNLAKPEYTASARARSARGIIPIKVVIDEEGKVISAKAMCGDPELRAAGEQAAKKSKFIPTTIDGKLVKITGIVIYNFLGY